MPRRAIHAAGNSWRSQFTQPQGCNSLLNLSFETNDRFNVGGDSEKSQNYGLKSSFVPIFSSELDYLNSRLIISIATSRLVITTTQPSRAILQLLEFSPFAKYSMFNSAKLVACSSVANVINVQDLE